MSTEEEKERRGGEEERMWEGMLDNSNPSPLICYVGTLCTYIASEMIFQPTFRVRY